MDYCNRPRRQSTSVRNSALAKTEKFNSFATIASNKSIASDAEGTRNVSSFNKRNLNSHRALEIKEIKQIVDLMKKSDLTEFAVEEENFKLKIKRDTGKEAQPQIVSYAPAAPAPQAAPAAAEAPAGPAASAAAPADDNATYITSPMVGTFYSSPSPESPAYVKSGDKVSNDSIVCIIEAMKIMNEIQAEQSGSIAEVLVENGQPVEYGQRLFRLS